MDRIEMSNLFDVLYNNITSNQAPGLNEYEKSVFLTKAQDEIVKNYFLPQSNPKQAGFDDNQKRQIDFSMLMRTYSGTNEVGATGMFDPRALVYSLPLDLFIMVNEQIHYKNPGNSELQAIRQVIPISYEEYTRLMSKPFKEPLKYQAWRLLTGVNTTTDTSDEDGKVGRAEIIITSADKEQYTASDKYYSVRYIKRPNPIILVNLSDVFGETLKIHGEVAPSNCELDPQIHEEIVQRAVELAKVAWSAADQNAAQVMIQAGQRSE